MEKLLNSLFFLAVIATATGTFSNGQGSITIGGYLTVKGYINQRIGNSGVYNGNYLSAVPANNIADNYYGSAYGGNIGGGYGVFGGGYGATSPDCLIYPYWINSAIPSKVISVVIPNIYNR